VGDGDGGGGRRLLVGLGNPGERYAGTRHNFGFMAVERIARAAGGSWSRRGESLVSEAVFEGQPVLLAKPETFMNLSGLAVVALRQDEGVAVEKILIYLDDLALPLGVLRIRERGSAGGHRGLASVLENLGDEGVPRMRLGIAGESDIDDTARFVLEPFAPEERQRAEQVLERAVAATRVCLREGIAKAMSIYNRIPEGFPPSGPSSLLSQEG
jgi:PTH1 family peptidyl-tRNA hydrolase